MKTRSHRAGAALIESLISTTIMALSGAIIYTILNTGMILFAKNTAINVAHQQARVAVLQMEQDLHSAVSIPQLTDANKNVLTGNGPAAGITFQIFTAGPFQIPTQALANQNKITVRVNGYVPVVGQRLCLPRHQVEYDITAVGSGTTDRQLTLSTNLTRPIEVQLDDAGTLKPVVVTGFITDRFTYVVKNGELRYYKPGGPADGRLLANDITSATPFSVPVTPAGAQYNRFVAAINLSTADDRSTNRGFKAANMFLNAQVPYRSKLCYYQ